MVTTSTKAMQARRNRHGGLFQKPYETLKVAPKAGTARTHVSMVLGASGFFVSRLLKTLVRGQDTGDTGDTVVITADIID